MHVNFLICVAGNFEEAKSHAETALQLEPLSSLFHAMHSVILHALANSVKLLTHAKQGLKWMPIHFYVLSNAGSAQIALHQYEEAITSFESACKLSTRQFYA